jgi:hypothetical protein
MILGGTSALAIASPDPLSLIKEQRLCRCRIDPWLSMLDQHPGFSLPDFDTSPLARQLERDAKDVKEDS